MAKAISNMTCEISKEIQTRVSRIWMDEEGIVRVVSSPLVEEILIEDAEANVAAIARISGGKRCLCFIDPVRRKSASREARLYYVKKFPDVVKAVVILQTSPAVKVLVNFMMGMNKTINKEKIPARFFTSEKEVLAWLREFKDP